MTLREQVPKPLRLPVGFASLGVMLVGLTVGYILTMLGITLYFDLNGLGEQITNTEALTVTGMGLAAAIAGYFGWRGFNYFSY